MALAQERASEMALRDAGAGREWTFGQLRDAGERAEAGTGQLVCARGNTADFILQVLAGWRAGAVVCPLEPGQEPPDVPPPPIGCAHLKTTSASTGKARLVALTEAQLAADADQIVATMGLRPDWPNLGVISLAHSYGFSNLVLPLLLHGIPLILAASPLPEIVRRAVAGEGTTTLPAVPAMWRAWHEAQAIPACVKLAISAGAPLMLDLEREVYGRWGLKIHNFYGSSECGGIAYDERPEPRESQECVGSPMRNVTLTVGETGCLRVSGAAVGETYWPEPDARLGGGVFETSDLGEVIDGRVYLRGRSGDMIHVAGRKVAPEAIERVLARHPEVRECVVFGVPSADADRTELIVATVQPRRPISPGQLRDYLLEQLPAWQVPREWLMVDQTLADHRGKVSRAVWRQEYLKSAGR